MTLEDLINVIEFEQCKKFSNKTFRKENKYCKAKNDYSIMIILNGPRYFICMQDYDSFKKDLRGGINSLKKYASCKVTNLHIFGDQFFSDDYNTHFETVEIDITIKCKQ